MVACVLLPPYFPATPPSFPPSLPPSLLTYLCEMSTTLSLLIFTNPSIFHIRRVK